MRKKEKSERKCETKTFHFCSVKARRNFHNIHLRNKKDYKVAFLKTVDECFQMNNIRSKNFATIVSGRSNVA